MPYAIGIDVGTTNLKVALVRDDATPVGAAQRPLPIERGPGTAEQDSTRMWAELVDAVAEVTTAHPAEASEVAALAVCSQYSSIVPIDASGEPVAPMLMWQDQRGTDHSFAIMARHDDAFMTFAERHGIPPIGSGLSLGHILHVQLDRPDVHAATAAYVEAMDYVTARLTGRITASQHTSFMVQCCDNRTLGATAYDDELVALAGVDATRLPPLVPVDAEIGTLQPDVAAALGLPASVSVYAPANDTAGVAVAAGALRPGRAGLAIGTTSVLVDGVADFRTDLEHQILSMPGPDVDRYVVCAENGLGGKVVEHVLERFVYADDELGDHRVGASFAQLDAVLGATAPNAGGVMFLPWLNGSLAPIASGSIRGGFVNMSLETGRAELVRAVVEGVAHNLAWLLPHVEVFTGERIDEIVFVGGAARSVEWCRVLADVIGRPVSPLAGPEGGAARAMALLALERHGVLTRADLDRAASTTTATYEPDFTRHEQYAYRQVQFEAAHAALLPISDALNKDDMSSAYPYAQTHDVIRGMPSEGRSRDSIVAELTAFARDEDATWETGKCSGTMYCGDHAHYDFMGRIFELFAHVNALQRDMCPSMTKFEGEIIAMTLDLLHADAIGDSGNPAGLVTSGGSGSILHAVLAYREQAQQTRGIDRPNFVKPETGHPGFDKACHLLGVELRRAPIDPDTTLVDVDQAAKLIDENTIAMMGSACNYGYGTIDPIAELSDLALERGIGLHVDGCLGGFILPWGQELGYDIPVFDFRIPGVTSISADTHKYGYGFKGSSVLAFRDIALRDSQYFFMTDWSGGKYASPGIEGSRSGGLLAATWAAMVSFGRTGYLEYAKRIFETAFAMQDAVRSHPELKIMGSPTFCFSFRSDEFDIYHVNDFMRTRGWRFNGQQYPNSIHMAVTRPQTQPGVVEAFTTDLAEAVPYALAHKDEKPASGAIYGGIDGGMTDEADDFIRTVMTDMLDKHQGLPRETAE